MNNEKQHFTKEFVQQNSKRHPKADSRILTFIAEFLTATGTDLRNMDTIRQLFRAGSCYYFAQILKDAFPGGEASWAAPFGHIIYVYQGIPYDIDGVYKGDVMEYIPVKYLGKAIDDFRHIPDVAYNATEQELAKIMFDYRERQKGGKTYECQD